MSDLRTLLFALTAIVLVTAPAVAADFPVKVAAVRVGLPSEGDATVAEFAAWAPVYVDLELTGPVPEATELVIEALDSDEITTTLIVPLNLAGVGGTVSTADLGAIGYVRPAGTGDITITVRGANGGKSLSEPFRIRSLRPRDPLTYLVLSLGKQPVGFDLPRPVGGASEQSPGFRGGRVELAAITEVAQLPDQWFGFDAADVVVLQAAPGTEDFLRRVFGDAGSKADKAKLAALREWVRRGGRLVVAVGANAGLVTQLPGLQELLPFDVKGVRASGSLALYWGARETSQTTTFSGALISKSGTFPIAELTPKADRPGRILIPPPDRRTEDQPIIAGQSAYGLGRVTLIAFDLDRPPFSDLAQRPEFWDWILREGGAARASVGSEGKPRPLGVELSEDEDDLAVAIRTHADTFDGVPVVSFGWVALLIVLYILLIGPVEYFFLKRVLGRLELTWITFPIIVATVSLAAYFTAYSMKGRDLKVNKIDIVDVDAASGRVYGTTWFTLFSPRIDNYTLAITAGEGWGNEPEAAGTAISWVGSPRGGRASLLRRGYRYHTDGHRVADGLENVPIQVWSTKSFVANWSSQIDPGLFDYPNSTERLQHPAADRSAVYGAFVNRLPIPVLSDCVVFYAGQAYPLPGGTIRAGETVRVVLDQGGPATEWLKRESKLETDLLPRSHGYRDRVGGPKAVGAPAAQEGPALASVGGPLPLLGMLFHEAALRFGEGVFPSNASLRRLDQSWRLTPEHRSEVILVGRVALPTGPAEETLSGANAASRLWLKGLPGSGEPRRPIPGTGRQETWVRVYLPVK